MRLKDYEIRAILDASREAFGDEAEVRVFGSRVDDTREGGDIDLHVVAPDITDPLEQRIRFMTMLWQRLGSDQKIDLIVRRRGYEPKGIDRIAMRDGVRLH